MPQTRSKRSEADQRNDVVPEDSDRPYKRARVNSEDPTETVDTTIASESSPTILGKEEEDEEEEEEGFQPLEEIRASDLYLDTASLLEHRSLHSNTHQPAD